MTFTERQIKNYLKGWEETHPEEDMTREEAINCLKDTYDKCGECDKHALIYWTPALSDGESKLCLNCGFHQTWLYVDEEVLNQHRDNETGWQGEDLEEI